jgi:hypothetical protein
MIIHLDNMKVSHAGKGHVRSRSECFLSLTLLSYSDESTPCVRLNISARSYGYEHSLDSLKVRHAGKSNLGSSGFVLNDPLARP